MNKAQIEILYNQQKKNMVVAYILWLFLGGIGAQYFYAKEPLFGGGMLVLLVFSFVMPIPFTLVHIFAAFAGVVHTFFVVEKINNTIREEIEIMCGDNGA